MDRISVRLVVIAILLAGAVKIGGDAHAGLRAGAAKVDITPPVGLTWAFDGKPMTSIEDNLYARALVLDDGYSRIALAATDLLWVTSEMTAAIREIVTERTGIPPDNIMVSATHTHYIPKVDINHNSDGTLDSMYVLFLIREIAGSIILAANNLQEASFGYTTGDVPELVYNRRTKTADGMVTMSFELPRDFSHLTFGPIDPEVGILRIDDAGGNIIASVVNYACHPTSAGYNELSYILSPDYPGYTTRVVETIAGGICLFTLGAAGDIVVTERGKKQRKEIGTALGGEVVRRIQRVPYSAAYDLKAARRGIVLPLKKHQPEDGINVKESGRDEIDTEIQAFRMGDLFFLGLPGEILVEIGLELKRRFAPNRLMILSLCNDTIGYVCHEAAYDEGGYESGRATNLARGAGEIVIREALSLLERISR